MGEAVSPKGIHAKTTFSQIGLPWQEGTTVAIKAVV